MSLYSGPYPPLPRDSYFSPPWVVGALADYLGQVGFCRRGEIWEPAAGDGVLARELCLATGVPVLATDIAPQADDVAPLDFLTAGEPSGEGPLHIITNPPYGSASRLAIAFAEKGLSLIAARGGTMALLLPFEFDARETRNRLVGEHPLFLAKRTLKCRVRWRNLPSQSDNEPMGAHSWFIWSADAAMQQRARLLPRMVAA